MPRIDSAIACARAARRRFVAELAEFVGFASVSAQPARAPAVTRCAEWLAAHLREAGMEEVRVTPTAGHPIVTANWLHRPHAPTLLIYGHYDVQPADPEREWRSPPFSPEVRGGHLYGRGTSDDKGQMFAHVKALESWLRAADALPVNVRCLFEGEEETGSTHLGEFMRMYSHAVAADVAVVSDSWVLAADRPAIVESLRGALGVEVELRGAPRDLHAGNFGGAVYNPLKALSELLAGLHDRHGRIAVDGIYDRVREFTPQARAYMSRSGPTDAELLDAMRVSRGWGEEGYSLYERITIRPALILSGIDGGYTGPGAKAILPARAMARIDLRLVPDQDPYQVEHLLTAHIRRNVPQGMRVVTRTTMRAHPFVMSRDAPGVSAARAAYQGGYGIDPVFLRLGGTVPIAHMLTCRGVPLVMMGFALPDDAMHSLDERFSLAGYFRGIETSIHFMSMLATRCAGANADTRSDPLLEAAP
ncbi:dipeptidase [Paraburkholderia sp. UCT31]|uniref:dipeptidase n=1 Tax=Paraburkholderia sp. UCT31 TaxID=2615209 RepID=UPI001655FFBD|nr:dipeptidase [Paraburkholderia sp. UCT31]MBC8740938.1 dipeptidase [Paraburkholderia sp. UCT31]